MDNIGLLFMSWMKNKVIHLVTKGVLSIKLHVDKGKTNNLQLHKYD